MSMTELNKLARDYADGMLDLFTYRQSRTQLLNKLVGAEDLSHTRPSVAKEKGGTPAVPQPEPSSVSATSRKRFPAPLIAGAAGVAIAGAIGLYLSSPVSQDNVNENTTTPITATKIIQPDTTIATDTSAGFHALVLATYNTQNWSQTQVQKLHDTWMDTSTSDRRAFLDSTLYQKTSLSIIEELQALISIAEISPEESIDDLELLGEFANLIEIPFELTEHIDLFASEDLAEPVAEPEPIAVPVEAETRLPHIDNGSKLSASAAKASSIMPAPKQPKEPKQLIKNSVDTSSEKQEKTANSSSTLLNANTASKESASTSARTDKIAAEKPPTNLTTKAPRAMGNSPPKAEARKAIANKEKPTRPQSKYSCLGSLSRFCVDLIDEATRAPVMIQIPPVHGVTIGSERNASESPTQLINRLNYNFFISQTEISFEHYRDFCVKTERPIPEQPWSDINFPIVNVSWDDGVAYTRWLSNITGVNYRLATDIEWELATRAGSDGPYPFGDRIASHQARFSTEQRLETPIAVKADTIAKNKYRLYNTVGNVQEWVADNRKGNTDENLKVVRGGAYADTAEDITSASRRELSKTSRNSITGFRIAFTRSEAAIPQYLLDKGRQWLNNLPDSAYTLQLFRVEKPAAILNILEQNPGQNLHIIKQNNQFHLLAGSFNTKQDAKDSIGQIAKKLTGVMNDKPYAKQVSSLR